MDKLDLTRLYKTYSAGVPEIKNTKPSQYLSLTGKGDLTGDVFLEKVKALYATAYAIKFKCKQAGRDLMVPKLEIVRYGVAEAAENEGDYRLLLRVPRFVTEQDVQNGIKCVMVNMDIQLANDITIHHIGANSKSR